jgi:hypothetical protein
MNDESARQGALPNYTRAQSRHRAGRALAHLRNGYTYLGWIDVGGGLVEIDGRLRVITGPSHARRDTYRSRVQRTYPVRALRCVEWMEPIR